MELSAKLWQVADELRGIASEGLTWCEDPYQRRRFERVLRLAAELSSLQDVRTPEALERLYREQLSHVSPWVGANAAIFDDADRILLIQRRDDQLWAVPGGLLEIGEAPSDGARRETREETGIDIDILALAGVYDWSRAGGHSQPGHLHGYLFTGRPTSPGLDPVITNETINVDWFVVDDLPALSGGHRTIVPDAIAFWKAEHPSSVFH